MALRYGAARIRTYGKLVAKANFYKLGILNPLTGSAKLVCNAAGAIASDIVINAGAGVTPFTSGNKTGRFKRISYELTNAKTRMFSFQDLAFILTGKEVFYYDGDYCKRLVDNAYIPILTLGRPPAGGGTPNEKLNYLSDSWKDSFSPDGTTKDFSLSFKDLSAVAVKAWINGAEKAEGIDFTVDRTLGKATFTTAPAEGTNTVVIQATKDGLMDRKLINECKYFSVYGGANDTRIFLTGNSEGAVYWCDVMNPFYWPEDCYAFIGNDSDQNTGLIVHYQDLVLFKKRSIYRISQQFNSDGTTKFESFPVNSSVGCDIPDSIQMIDNNVVFANTYSGVHVLTRTDVREEKNVDRISSNINGTLTRPGLLNEKNLEEATSIDYDGKYQLCVGSNVYLWDYSLSPYIGAEETLVWFKYNNINANVFFEREHDLYYGKRDTGEIVRFTKEYSIWGQKILNDFGSPIKAYWKSKVFNFGLPEWLKTVKEIHFRTREVLNTALMLRYFNDEGEPFEPLRLVASSFSYDNFLYDTFSYDVHYFPPVFRLRPKMKKVIYFQFEVRNEELYQDISLLDLIINQTPTKRVK